MRPVRCAGGRLAVWLALLGCVVAASCAPRPTGVAPLDRGALEQRYRAMARAHTRQVRAVQADLVMRARAPERGNLPWVNGRMLMVAPDRLRVRFGSLLGTALDLAARGDTVEAWVPKDQLGLIFAAAGDSLGVRAPGRLAYRILSGAWWPPAAAWRAAVADGEGLAVAWADDADSLTLTIGSEGRPETVEWKDARGGTWIVRYGAWSRRQGLPWPGRLEIDLLPSGWRVQCRMARVRFIDAPAHARLTVTFPDRYTRLTRADLREVIEHLGRDE